MTQGAFIARVKCFGLGDTLILRERMGKKRIAVVQDG